MVPHHAVAALALVACLVPGPAGADGPETAARFRPALTLPATRLLAAAPMPVATVVTDPATNLLIAALVQRSPAFRRQWDRARATPRLSLRITRLPPGRWGGPEGWTTFTAHADGLDAHMHVAAPAERVVEVLAHELEHVLEQLDGVRLAARHTAGDPSVHVNGDGTETRRALASGRRVAEEFARTLGQGLP